MMKQPCLTIAIPTYNREELLERQLLWLSSQVKDRDDVELIIADNCSTDGTQAVIERRRNLFGHLPVRVFRRPENIGPVRNIANCIGSAEGRHVWVMSDDDPVHDQAVGKVMSAIIADPDLALIVLNFSTRDIHTGKVLGERRYPIEGDISEPTGATLFGRLLEIDNGGVTLTTALVYRTDLGKRAVADWEAGLSNLAVQMYWTGYVAWHGSAQFLAQPLLECTAGDHHFLSDPAVHRKMIQEDVPAVYGRLIRLGYPRYMFTRMFLAKLLRKRRAGDLWSLLQRAGRVARNMLGSKGGQRAA